MMQYTAVLDMVKPFPLKMSIHFLNSEVQTGFFTFWHEEITCYQ